MDVFKCYFRYWRRVFKPSLGLTAGLTAFFVIGIVDLQFFSRMTYLQWLNPVVILLMVMGVMIYGTSLFLYTIESKSLKITLKEGTYLAFKRWPISMLSGLLIAALVLTMIIKPAFGFLVFPSLLMVIFNWNNRKLVE